MMQSSEESPLLSGEKVLLDAVRRDDLPISAKWTGDLDITYHLWTAAVKPITLEDEQEWFDNRDQYADTTYTFHIRTILDKQLIGQVGLSHYDARNRTAQLGIAIGIRDEQNKGYGTEAVRLIIDYGFREMNLNRIELAVSPFNPRAIHVYEKTGFTHEGVKRQALYRDGRYHDVIVMAMLRDEWRHFRSNE